MRTVALVRQAQRRRAQSPAGLLESTPGDRGKIKKLFDSIAALPYITTTDGAAALSGR
jgi:hypothetical protein